MQIQAQRFAMSSNNQDTSGDASFEDASAVALQTATMARSGEGSIDTVSKTGGHSFAWYAEYLRKLADESSAREFEELADGDCIDQDGHALAIAPIKPKSLSSEPADRERDTVSAYTTLAAGNAPALFNRAQR